MPIRGQSLSSIRLLDERSFSEANIVRRRRAAGDGGVTRCLSGARRRGSWEGGSPGEKGHVLLGIQSSDVSGAYSDYRKAVADETLARTQLERAKVLFDRGAIAK